MDKELQDGGEQEDTWSGEGAEALAGDLLVDGETGESFPAQVLPLPLSPCSPDSPCWRTSRELALDHSCVFAVDLIVFWLRVYKGTVDNGLEALGLDSRYCRQAKCLAS